nr:helix-turn-helix domain-containing protein [Methylobacterium sp. Leaf122]
MKLADYLSEAEIRPATFAERIGVTRQTLWRYMSGDRRPEWDVLERIRTETGGEVTPNDFLEEAAPAEARNTSEAARADERTKPLRCMTPHGSAAFATEGQSR